MSPARPRHVLIAGLPHFVATLVAERIQRDEPASKLTLLAPPDHLDAVVARLGSARTEILAASLTREGFSLGAPKLRELRTSVTDVYNFVSVYHLGVDKRRAEDLNIQGTRLLLRFAQACPNLVCFNHYSTAFVAGDRTRIVLETELDQGQEFRNTYERTKFTAEVAIRRAMAETPIAVYRPSVVVGCASDGHIEALDGPHHLITLLANSAGRIPPSFPDRPRAPFNVVPADYVADAIHQISRDPRARGETFHLVDPAPIPTRHAIELISEQVEITGGTRSNAREALSARILGRLARSGGNFLHEFDGFRIFNPSNTLQALAGAVVCPPFHRTVQKLVAFRPPAETRRAAG